MIPVFLEWREIKKKKKKSCPDVGLYVFVGVIKI